jgi:hypothetical protein
VFDAEVCGTTGSDGIYSMLGRGASAADVTRFVTFDVLALDSRHRGDWAATRLGPSYGQPPAADCGHAVFVGWQFDDARVHVAKQR